MRLTSDHIVYLVVGGVYFGLTGLVFFTGHWIAGMALLAVFLLFVGRSGLFGGGEPAEPKTNCSDCGARNLVTNEVCSYCDEPLSSQTDTHTARV